MGYDLLSANSFGNAHHFRTDTMGILATPQVGRRMGEMDDKVSDGTFLWGHVVLRRLLRAVVVRHRALHTGGKPDSHHTERNNNGSLSAKLLLLGRLSDGGKHCSLEMPEPCAGPGGMDDTGG